jgi:hypothetical protein
MWKPRTLLILAACLAIIGALAFALAKPTEPTYKGHTLSYWVQTSDYNDEAETAIKAIGTNAIPVLIRWISYDPPQWRKKLSLAAVNYNRPNLVGFFIGPEVDKAVTGFRILGTNAAPALPALVNLIRDSPDHESSPAAIWTLGLFGEQALPYLTNELSGTDTNRLRRIAILESITTMTQHGCPTNACLPPLLNATTDPDPGVRSAATNFIRYLAPEALTNSPSP